MVGSAQWLGQLSDWVSSVVGSAQSLGQLSG